MNKRKVIHWMMLGIILTICYTAIYYQTKVITSGQIVYVPLIKENPVMPTNRGLELNFKQIIPNKYKTSSGGTIVGYINSFGVISFVRIAGDKSSEPLEFGERLLDYGVYHQEGLFASKKSKVFFGARYLPLSKETINEHEVALKRSRYLVLRLADDGFSVPIGIADRNYGTILNLYK